jgi:hypothetical protein
MDNSLCVESPPGTERKGWRTVCGLADRRRTGEPCGSPRTAARNRQNTPHEFRAQKKRLLSVRRYVRLHFGLPSPVAELAATGGLFSRLRWASRVWICPFDLRTAQHFGTFHL